MFMLLHIMAYCEDEVEERISIDFYQFIERKKIDSS